MAIIKTPILNGSGKIVDANLPDRLLDPALTATILDKIKTDAVPRWKATTAYLAGDKVLSPDGDVVSAKVNFTSGASYSAANWDLSMNVAGKLDTAEAVKNYAAKSSADKLADIQGRTATSYATLADRITATEQRAGGRPYANTYYPTSSPHSAATNNTLGEGVLRLVPWVVSTPMTLQELICEVTVSGDGGARFRMGVYADSGRCYPQTLMVDTGLSTVNISPFYRAAQTVLSLEPGLYWIGGVVQGTTTSQPTMRTVAPDWVPPVNNMSLGSALPTPGAAVTTVGYKATGITGALPTTFPDQGGGTVSAATIAPRILIRTMATAGKLPTAPLNWRGKDHNFYPHSVGATDQAIYGHAYNPAFPTSGERTLAWTTDGGETIQYGQNFGSLVISGEYVTWTGQTSAGYVVVTSSDSGLAGNWGSIWFSTSRTSGFTKVQTIKGTNELAISSPKPGPDGKTVLFVGEYSTDMPQPVHYLWMTKDGGATWTNIKTALNVDTTKNSHFHATEYDSVNNKIWSSQGDNGNSQWAYSADWGVTWTNVAIPTTDPLYQADSDYQQPTLIIPFGGRLVVGPDRGTFAAGVWTVNNDGTTPRVAWASVVGERAPWAYSRQPIARSGQEAVVPIIDRLAGSKTVYFIGTADGGLSWHLLSKVPLTYSGSSSPEGSGVVGPDAGGRIMWRSMGQNPEPYGNRLMVASMPTWV